ncbi:hypothetical protein H5410_045492 [Solanum commersonii]|uniref:Uncharacterized protein n=1 Tax=Solanum commersonii TaxID=4109 RepID=A0A9J5XBA2_SOLCO|nr:hypothetical protein H5410_045492 [Solanum commersonii]
MQKMMGSDIATNEIQMERIKKRRRESHMPEEPTSTPLAVGSSETKSDEIAMVVAKKRKEAEIERVKSKGGSKINEEISRKEGELIGVRTIVKRVKIALDEETLGIILGAPVKGIRSIEGCKPSSEFTKHATKRGDIKLAGLSKKFLKGEYQLLFEFINKIRGSPSTPDFGA